jgi:hypothetical protein
LDNWSDISSTDLDLTITEFNVDLFYLYDAAYKISFLSGNKKSGDYKEKALKLFSIPKVKTTIAENNRAYQKLNLDFSNYENFTKTELIFLKK